MNVLTFKHLDHLIERMMNQHGKKPEEVEMSVCPMDFKALEEEAAILFRLKADPRHRQAPGTMVYRGLRIRQQ